MLVRKGLRKEKYMSGGCQFFTQIQPYTPARKVASGAGGKNALPDKSLDRYFVIVARDDGQHGLCLRSKRPERRPTRFQP
jgi:hypothetical protein